MVNTKVLDPNKIKIDEKSYKNFLNYYIGYVTFQDLRKVKVNSVNLLYFTVYEINVYFKEINENKYLKLVPTNESEDTLKRYEELWAEIKDLIRPKTNNSDFMKIYENEI